MRRAGTPNSPRSLAPGKRIRPMDRPTHCRLRGADGCRQPLRNRLRIDRVPFPITGSHRLFSMSKIDALILGAEVKNGKCLVDRVTSITDIAEPLLGVNRFIGERAWIRQQPHGRLFVTRDPADTIFYPRDHERAGQPRYRWEKQHDGSEWGYLIETVSRS